MYTICCGSASLLFIVSYNKSFQARNSVSGNGTRLAVHIRGGDAISYHKLKEHSALLFDISKLAFDSVLRVLQDIGFARVIGSGTSKTVVPTVPYFDNMYETLGSAAEDEGLNELEQMSIHIVNSLAVCPRSKGELASSLGTDSPTMERILRIGKAGSYINEVNVEDESLLVSPLYFAEKPEEFARVVKKHGEASVSKVFKLLRQNPGWPLSKLMQTQEIAGTGLSQDEFQIAMVIVKKGLVQPPEITTSYSGTNEFLFTPPLGTNRILVVEKEIYEKAMACISCVRQGEHFGHWNIKWPSAIIRALLNYGELKPTTLAKEQYRPMCIRGIVRLQKVRGDWWKPVLVDIPENRRALLLALEMLGGGEVLTERGYDSDSVKAIYSDSDYTEAIRGYGNVVQRKKIPKPRQEYEAEIDNLLFDVQKGT